MARKRTAKSTAISSQTEQALSFEQALERLEAAVERLETGELDLDDALATFEEGVKLSRHCAATLQAAERKVELLSRDGGDLKIEPFAVDEAAFGDEEE